MGIETLHPLIQTAKAQRVPVRYHAVAPFSIEKAQDVFGHPFCHEYYQFLRQFGFLQIHQHHVLGLSQSSPSAHDKHSFLWATLRFRQQYFNDARLSVVENSNDQWFFLLNHADGKLYGFDAIEAKYKKNYYPLLQPEPTSFMEYLHEFVQGFLSS
ncbi:MAG: SMI1/KNR4 family protein [Pseudomonadota bacterium]